MSSWYNSFELLTESLLNTIKIKTMSTENRSIKEQVLRGREREGGREGQRERERQGERERLFYVTRDSPAK